jgi:hypothetical protein
MGLQASSQVYRNSFPPALKYHVEGVAGKVQPCRETLRLVFFFFFFFFFPPKHKKFERPHAPFQAADANLKWQSCSRLVICHNTVTYVHCLGADIHDSHNLGH